MCLFLVDFVVARRRDSAWQPRVQRHGNGSVGQRVRRACTYLQVT